MHSWMCVYRYICLPGLCWTLGVCCCDTVWVLTWAFWVVTPAKPEICARARGGPWAGCVITFGPSEKARVWACTPPLLWCDATGVRTAMEDKVGNNEWLFYLWSWDQQTQVSVSCSLHVKFVFNVNDTRLSILINWKKTLLRAYILWSEGLLQLITVKGNHNSHLETNPKLIRKSTMTKGKGGKAVKEYRAIRL